MPGRRQPSLRARGRRRGGRARLARLLGGGAGAEPAAHQAGGWEWSARAAGPSIASPPQRPALESAAQLPRSGAQPAPTPLTSRRRGWSGRCARSRPRAASAAGSRRGSGRALWRGEGREEPWLPARLPYTQTLIASQLAQPRRTGLQGEDGPYEWRCSLWAPLLSRPASKVEGLRLRPPACWASAVAASTRSTVTRLLPWLDMVGFAVGWRSEAGGRDAGRGREEGGGVGTAAADGGGASNC